jgi:hypothetical protein
VYKPFIAFAQGFMELLGMDVPKPDNSSYYENVTLRRAFMENPETVSEDRYLEVLSALVHQSWHPMEFKKLKAMLYRTATVYNEVTMEIGKKQRA